MKKFKVWLNSGANAYSEYSTEVTTEDIGASEEEWNAMSEDEKESVMREIAFERSEWGFKEITE